VRLCAEDPAQRFLPQTGRVLMWQAPAQVRVDHAVAAGDQVPPFYDSMIAKLIAHAPDRARAINDLRAALRETRILGVRTNQAFLEAALGHQEFADGHATTAFVERHAEALLGGLAQLPAPVAALLAYAARSAAMGHDPARVALPPRWPMATRIAVDGVEVPASVLALGGRRYRVGAPEGEHELSLAAWHDGGAVISGDTGHLEVAYRVDGTRGFAAWGSAQAVIDDLTFQSAVRAGGAAHNLVRAPMAGRIVSLAVSVGQKVEKGAPLLALEAMKMEHPALASMAGTVKAIHVAVGAQVTAGAPLVELEPAAA
jgi:geranyl-CoA carboxylase alpha subunit